MRRRCLDCRALCTKSRCPDCERTRKARRNREARHARAIVAAHVDQHGAMCPGWRREPHPARPDELTADHLVAFADGGELARDGAQVLCTSCNSRKGRRG